MNKNKFLFALIVFLLSFTVYLATLCPTVPPYRDSGELASVSYKLGIAHPPGYPLYTIVGKIFTLIPSGEIAFRINIMSAFFGAVTVALVYLIMADITGSIVLSLTCSLIWAFSRIFWELALVSETYTLDTFFIAFMLFIVLGSSSSKYLYLLCFIAGLSLTNRLTVILCGPAFIYLLWSTFKEKKWHIELSDFILAIFLFVLGVSVYIFLPLRSMQNPPIDWGDPQTLERLIAVITRKAYGHSLDKVSEQYRLSEVLLPQLRVYMESLYRQFTILGITLACAGIYTSFRKNKSRAVFLMLFFLLSGPVFIILAKMPDNPHALKIMEPSYLIPNMIFLLWIGLGARTLMSEKKDISPLIKIIPRLVIAMLPLFLIARNVRAVNKHNNYFACDYATNILYYAEKSSIIFIRKDVQLFSVWYIQEARKEREDVMVVAQGLFLSDWYRNQLKKKYPDIIFPEWEYGMTKETYTKEFVEKNFTRHAVYITADFEIENEFFNYFRRSSEGLLTRLLPPGEPISVDAAKINLYNRYRYRGLYNTLAYSDFFTAEIINEYAFAHNELGLLYFNSGMYVQANEEYANAVRLKPDYALVYYNIGINYFSMQLYDRAIKSYMSSIKYYEGDFKNRLLRNYVVPELAKVYNNLGATYEKKSDFEKALQSYYKAVELKEDFDEAYYNIGVVYWRENRWKEVISAFEKTLSINPSHESAVKYLYIAKKKLEETERE